MQQLHYNTIKTCLVSFVICICLCVCLCYRMEKQARVALNLSKIEDMQARLRHNLEAIGMLNQQVRAHTHANIHPVLAVLLPN